MRNYKLLVTKTWKAKIRKKLKAATLAKIT